MGKLILYVVHTVFLIALGATGLILTAVAFLGG